jgi:4-amino-4-deoxy-L-arabinose transferase-like glycosyltransferase
MAKQIKTALIFGVLLRIAWALLVPVVPVSDSGAYDAFARNLVEHGVYGWEAGSPHAFWPPGTSLLYAGLYWAFGYSYAPIVVLNIVLSALLINTCSRIATRLYSERAGHYTAWIIALWPTLVFYVTVLASELPFVLLITLALDCWTVRQRTIRHVLLAGVLLGAASLVRPLALVLPVVFGFGSLMASRLSAQNLRTNLVHVLAALAAMLVVIAPWTVRNVQLYEELVLVSTNGGITFWMGNTPNTDGAYMGTPEELAHLPDNELEKVLKARALDYIRQEPVTFIARTARKAFALYYNESIGVHWNEKGIEQRFGAAALVPLKHFTQVAWLCIFLLMATGIVYLLRTRTVLQLLSSQPLLIIAFFTAIYSVTVSQDRYHLSFASVIAILASVGLERVTAWKAALRARKS